MIAAAVVVLAAVVTLWFMRTDPGEPASGPTVARAQIDAQGMVDATRSVNVKPSNVTERDGTFCFSDLPFEFEGANLTVYGDDAFGQDAQVAVGEPVPPCGRGTEAQVTTPGGVARGFLIQFYR